MVAARSARATEYYWDKPVGADIGGYRGYRGTHNSFLWLWLSAGFLGRQVSAEKGAYLLYSN